MIRVTGFLFFILFFSSTFADQLCDSGCSLEIAFPNGGGIQAIDELTIHFGELALIDTVTTAMSPLKGDTLMLNAGESLEFAAGGKFRLGDQGNLDFTNVMIHTDGLIDLRATAGTKTLYFPAGSSFVISSQATILFDAKKLVIEGVLTRDSQQ